MEPGHAPTWEKDRDRVQEAEVEDPNSFHQQYLLMGKLGKGAFAQVHLCRRVCDGQVSSKDLAVKIADLRKHSGGRVTEEVDMRAQRAVEKEVSIMRKVGPQTYCVHQKEAFLEGAFTYIVMEKCDSTLLSLLERSTGLTEGVLAKIFKDMLKGLSVIHKIGIVHRDVKPDNFLVSGDPVNVKLCDFGLAAVLPHGEHPELTGVYGTAPFMSPEMLKAFPYGAKTDVWSMGVIVYVLLLGEFPYHPAESTSKAMKAAIVAGVPAPTFRPKLGLDMGGTLKISPEANSFLQPLLARDPENRLTADGSLQHIWLGAKEPGSWGSASLRPMLYSAKRVGAFDTRNVNDSVPNDMDHFLAQMQSKYHKSTMRNYGGSSSRTATPNRERERDRGSKDTKDSRDAESLVFEKPHKHQPSANHTSDVSTGAGSSSAPDTVP
jgi:serine/threonine protein kinase